MKKPKKTKSVKKTREGPIKKPNYFLLLLIIALIVLGGIHILRVQKEGVVLRGEETFHHLTIAQAIQSTSLQEAYTLFGGGRNGVNPYNVILAFVGSLVSLQFASLFVPFACGILALFCTYVLLRRARFSEGAISVTLAILIISPAFIYTFSTSNVYTLLIVLNICAILLLSHNTTRIQYLALPCAALIFLFGTLHTLVALLFLTVFMYLRYRSKRVLLLLFLLTVMSIAYVLSPYNANAFSQVHDVDVTFTFVLQNMISDLGSDFGFGIFDILLFFFGIIVSWRMKDKYFALYLLFTILFVLSLGVNYELVIYIYMLAAVFMGVGFVSIARMKWNLSLVGELTVVIIICGLLFSSIAYVNRSVAEAPNAAVIEGLEFLAQQEKGIVFTHYTRGTWVEALAAQPVLADTIFTNPESDRALLKQMDELFASRNVETILDTLQSYGVTYIFIDEGMKSGVVWNEEKEGMLFLFRNEELFNNIFSNKKVEIYKIDYSVSII